VRGFCYQSLAEKIWAADAVKATREEADGGGGRRGGIRSDKVVGAFVIGKRLRLKQKGSGQAVL